jgi:hypothetical protein
MGMGYCLNKRYVAYKSALVLGRTAFAKFFTLFARLILGLIGFLLIFIVVGKLFPDNTPYDNLFDFIRFALSGFWVSVAAPWVFIKIRLAEAEQNRGK